METLKIDGTDIILQDYENEGQGKIIVADNWRGAYTYSWGSMGSRLKEFILRINESYFADKLLGIKDAYVFSGKKTAANVRRYIRTEFEISWYECMSGHKELREKIKKIESMDGENEFVHMMSSISDSLFLFDLTREEEQEFKEVVGTLECEPWHFIGEEFSDEYKWLCKIHRKLKKVIQS